MRSETTERHMSDESQLHHMEPLAIPLLEWFRDNARVLPWRSDPTPYHVWLSEIMLQQTRVAAVLDYYRRFLEECPDILTLAELPEDRLMKLWQGLGYYSRARNLQKAAREIASKHGGIFPSAYEDVLALPGVGVYTAGAICSIAFGQPVPAVDGNVLRVVSRITGYDGDVTQPEHKNLLTEMVRNAIPIQAPGAFNQALMELGALLCLPNGAPLCDRCPVRDYCTAHQAGKELDYPVKPAKKERRVEERSVWLILLDGKAALRRRPARGLLAGLWEFPCGTESAPPLSDLTNIRPLGRAKHIFTHIEWHMSIYAGDAAEDTLPDGWVWAAPWELDSIYAVPSAYRRSLELARELLSQTTLLEGSP